MRRKSPQKTCGIERIPFHSKYNDLLEPSKNLKTYVSSNSVWGLACPKDFKMFLPPTIFIIATSVLLGPYSIHMCIHVYMCIWICIYILYRIIWLHAYMYDYHVCISCIYQAPFGRIRGAQEVANLLCILRLWESITWDSWDHRLICWNDTGTQYVNNMQPPVGKPSTIRQSCLYPLNSDHAQTSAAPNTECWSWMESQHVKETERNR